MARTVAIMLDLDWAYRRHLDVFTGLQRYAAEHSDWDCVIDEYAHDQLARNRRAYDGIIARATTELARKVRAQRVPTVNVWYNSPVVGQLPGVFPDYAETGRQAAEHLLQRGFRRFACLGAAQDRVHELQRNAYHQVLGAAGYDCRCAAVAWQYTKTQAKWRIFQQTVDRWIAGWQPPIGVFVTLNDVAGRHVIGAARRRGLRVPEDIGLVSGMNEVAVCLAPPPTLSSIDFSFDKVGYEAARMLDGLMKRKSSRREPPRLLVPPGGVVARQSTDFFAVEDDTVAAALRYISRAAGEAISVDKIAAHVHVGRRTLERRFREALGHSVAHEVRRLRVERAKRELIDSDASLKVIAGRCGFGNSKRMHEVFARDVREAPSEFRERHRV